MSQSFVTLRADLPAVAQGAVGVPEAYRRYPSSARAPRPSLGALYALPPNPLGSMGHTARNP